MNYAQARKNMVDCQIHPSGIVNTAILSAFEVMPREVFVPKEQKNIAYFDEDVRVSDGRYLLEPTTHARMLQALEPSTDDVVLDIGCASGYSAAILSSLVSTVIALDEDKSLLKQAQKTWDSLDVCNVVAVAGALSAGCEKHAPYDLIFLGGAVAEIPAHIVAQLSLKGRMVTIHKPVGQVMGDVKIIENLGEKGFSSYTLFEAAGKYLPGFEPRPAFAF